MFDLDSLQSQEDRELYLAIVRTEADLVPKFFRGDFSGYLAGLAPLVEQVRAYLDAVKINCEDAQLRRHRLTLMGMTQVIFNRVADIATLAGGAPLPAYAQQASPHTPGAVVAPLRNP